MAIRENSGVNWSCRLIQNFSEGQKFFSSPNRPPRSWGPHMPIFNGYRDSFPRVTRPERDEQDIYLAARLRTSRATSLPPLHIFTEEAEENLTFFKQKMITWLNTQGGPKVGTHCMVFNYYIRTFWSPFICIVNGKTVSGFVISYILRYWYVVTLVLQNMTYSSPADCYQSFAAMLTPSWGWKIKCKGSLN